ncbi:sensor histidine kinase [Lysobacter rhizosphaerae]
MNSGLADFIEHHAETIIEDAITFAKTVEVGTPLDNIALRDHLPEIVEAIVADLRTPQTRAEEIAKSEGRALAPIGRPRSSAGTHALHRAHSGYSISNLVSEYRALRASVLRLWANAPDQKSASADEVTRFNEAIDEAIAESVSHYAVEVERWRNIFLGVLGHDLRSPLSAIVMTSEMIAHMAVDAPIATAAQRLIRSGVRMRELLDKLLVYNRAQIGMGFEVEKADVDLAHECREEIELLRASMPETRIQFESPGSLRGMFDAAHIREALANLVVNAQKYGTRGGDIRVELRDEGSGAELTVGNAGNPIPRETLDLMFEPLRRGGVSGGESEQASLGLGLFIVSQIAQAHAGTIRAESGEGTTTFKLHLPRI